MTRNEEKVGFLKKTGLADYGIFSCPRTDFSSVANRGGEPVLLQDGERERERAREREWERRIRVAIFRASVCVCECFKVTHTIQ